MNQANLRSASVDGSLSGAFKMKIVLTPKLSPAVEMGVAIGAVFDGKREFRIQRWVFYVAPDKMCILHLCRNPSAAFLPRKRGCGRYWKKESRRS